MTTILKCFVIMPITTPFSYIQNYNGDSDHFTNILSHLFTPALEKAGFETISPKSTGSELIHADIIANLSTSDLVLCDISMVNPNVFFEFGIRCALDKPVALVKDDKTEKVPFDIGIINLHTYKSAPIWDKDEEIERLSVHIKESYDKSKDHNALWKYYGIKESGAFSPENATVEDKLDFIIQKIASDNTILEIEKSGFSNLTQTETRILLLITEGKTNREIAVRLMIGEGTTRNYVSSILQKLGVNNRAEAAAYAVENDLKGHLSID